VGLLVGRDGFPLEIASFEGNRAEVKTSMEVLETFRARYGLESITVTADAAMLSSANIQALEDAGYHYIIGSRIAKTPYEIEEYTNESDSELKDGQIFDTRQSMNSGKKTARIKRRVIYQYRKKRADLDLRNIDKLLTKAEKMVAGSTEFKRNRFLKVSGSKREINYDLVESSRKRAGIKGYVTDLLVPAQEVIDAYHQLFEVERSFRMVKSDLKARPIFHRKRDSIEAHLTVVFAALAIARTIQVATGITIKKFIRALEEVRTGVIVVNNKEYEVSPYIPDEVKQLLVKLGTR
jgi:transposase